MRCFSTLSIFLIICKKCKNKICKNCKIRESNHFNYQNQYAKDAHPTFLMHCDIFLSFSMGRGRALVVALAGQGQCQLSVNAAASTAAEQAMVRVMSVLPQATHASTGQAARGSNMAIEQYCPGLAHCNQRKESQYAGRCNDIQHSCSFVALVHDGGLTSIHPCCAEINQII